MPKHPCRLLVVGQTGAGKTNFLMNFMKKCGNFDKVIIVAKDLSEALYKMIAQLPEDMVQMYDDINDLPALDSLDKSQQHLIIFDDFITDRKAQPTIKEYFVRGRKKNVSCAYLSQMFQPVLKDIRLQTSHILLRNINSRKELNRIISEFNLGVDRDEIVKLYRQATMNDFDFFMIDNTEPESRRYKRNFSDVLNAPTTGEEDDEKEDTVVVKNVNRNKKQKK